MSIKVYANYVAAAAASILTCRYHQSVISSVYSLEIISAYCKLIISAQSICNNHFSKEHSIHKD